MEEALDALAEALLAIGYLNPENPGAILAELRRHAGPRATHAARGGALRGMARQVEWAAAEILPPEATGNT